MLLLIKLRFSEASCVEHFAYSLPKISKLFYFLMGTRVHPGFLWGSCLSTFALSVFVLFCLDCVSVCLFCFILLGGKGFGFFLIVLFLLSFLFVVCLGLFFFCLSLICDLCSQYCALLIAHSVFQNVYFFFISEPDECYSRNTLSFSILHVCLYLSWETNRFTVKETY